MSRFPDDVKYSLQHLWVRLGDGREVRVGGTDHWVQAAGTVVHVGLPVVGVAVLAGDQCGELVGPTDTEPVIAPVDGVVTTVNDALSDQPELLGTDPYGAGWLFEVELPEDAVTGELPLMDAEGYANYVGE